MTESGLPSHNGNYYIDMSSNWGEIYQYFTTTPGATYTVQFYVSGIVDGGLKLAVYAGANTGQIFTDYITEDDLLAERNANIIIGYDGLTIKSDGSAGYTLVSFPFEAESSDSLLSIALLAGASGLNLDDVSVTTTSSTSTVPEPGTLLLLCFGMVGLGGLRLRKKV